MDIFHRLENKQLASAVVRSWIAFVGKLKINFVHRKINENQRSQKVIRKKFPALHSQQNLCHGQYFTFIVTGET